MVMSARQAANGEINIDENSPAVNFGGLVETVRLLRTFRARPSASDNRSARLARDVFHKDSPPATLTTDTPQ
jgi:hypothetical protein